MGNRGKKLKSVKNDREESEEEEQVNPTMIPIELSSDDDEEANEDLSLKIVQKAMLRACTNPQNDAELENSKNCVSVIDLSSPPPPASREAEIIPNTKKKSRRKDVEHSDDPVDETKEQGQEASKTMEIVKLAGTNPVEKADNAVLRKLLRGPRYFDPPDGGWGTCYNCGEDGHTTVNCTSAKRKKPCYVCGSLEHHAKQCAKAQDCFICKKGGHRAKDCPERYKGASKSSKICLKCGDSAHDMFSCKNDYPPEDLKEMQCYVCKSFGHLCCVNNTHTGPREVSCYRCGQSGHTGLACGKSYGETTGAEVLNSCYKCGEEGHFARECTSSTKVAKRNRALSTPKKRLSREDRNFLDVRSGPHDIGRAHKRKKNQYEERGFTMSPKLRKRGGWITDDPEDLFYSKAKANGWRSPTTQINKSNRTANWSGGSHASSSHSSRKPGKLPFGSSATNASARFYKHGHSASRFGNSSSGGMRRHYEW